jgi:hypothetical protein
MNTNVLSISWLESCTLLGWSTAMILICVHLLLLSYYDFLFFDNELLYTVGLQVFGGFEVIILT